MPLHVPTKPTVLVVDDEGSIRLMLMAALTLHGFEVATAERVDDAIGIVDKESIDAVVLDVRMPGRCGLELLDYIRVHDRLRTLPVMVLTGAELTDAERATIERHGAEIFYKPESHFSVVAHLDRVTRRMDDAFPRTGRRPGSARRRRS